MNVSMSFLRAVAAFLMGMLLVGCGSESEPPPLQIGWAVGWVTDPADGSVVGPSILHTRNGGDTWVEQADTSGWPGYSGTDVSAVDESTAWVTLSGPGQNDAAILHTRDGGVTWTAQTLPAGVLGGMKQVRGLTRREAWAASLQGTVLHTTDGGDTWNPVSSVPQMVQVNRMDAIGCVDPRDPAQEDDAGSLSNANIWIADVGGGNWGMVHSLYNGELWRQEYVPYTAPRSTGVHMVSAYSPRVVWAAANLNPTVFRTLDGGETWSEVATAGGPNDLDDMCATGADTLWAVENQNTAGTIYHVLVLDGGNDVVAGFDPVNGYLYEGMTCADDKTALVVGFAGPRVDPSLPVGLIVSTKDGGQSWQRHSGPLDNVSLWKTSFVGARR